MKDDQFDWRRHNGKTTSVNTGPSVDHTLGTSKNVALCIYLSVYMSVCLSVCLSVCVSYLSTYRPTYFFFFFYYYTIFNGY